MTRQRRLQILVENVRAARRGQIVPERVETAVCALANYVVANAERITIASDPEKPEAANG